jgi:hypothetical protein
MITSSVNSYDFFDRFTEQIERRTLHALNEAARQGAIVADRQSVGLHSLTWRVILGHGTEDGWASAIKAKHPLWHIYDFGSLGKRGRTLKGNDRRKDSWTVRKRGINPYVAHRHPETLTDPDKGIKGRTISNPARTAGRKALIAALRRR